MICISPHTSPTKPLLHCIDDDAEGADCEGRQDFKQNSLCVVFTGQATLVNQTRVEVEAYLNKMTKIDQWKHVLYGSIVLYSG